MSSNDEHESEPRAFPFCGGLAIGCAAVAILGSLFLWNFLSGWHELLTSNNGAGQFIAFDSALWHDQELPEDDPYWPPRLCMVDDLLASRVLNGATRDEVEALLGMSRTTRWPTVTDQGESVITYYLGPERGPFSVDDEWLSISFSGEDTVSRAWLWTD